MAASTTGDAATRESAPEDFCSSILLTEVRVVAITNHNIFDLAQFEDIRMGLGKYVQRHTLQNLIAVS